MKIAVLLLTRNRLASLVTVAKALDVLASGRNEITIAARYDDDDSVAPKALAILHSAGVEVMPVVARRPVTLGVAWNEGIAALKALPFEAITFLPDDVIPLTAHWDEIIRLAIEDRRLDAFSWHNVRMPGLVTVPAFSRAYLEALEEPFSAWFPFWFADTWIGQVYEFARGAAMPILTGLSLIYKEGSKTSNLRDMQFWVDFWGATRKLRIAEAAQVALRMGWGDLSTVTANAEAPGHGEYGWNVEAIERMRGDPAPPGPLYLKAKARAEAWLKSEATIAR